MKSRLLSLLCVVIILSSCTNVPAPFGVTPTKEQVNWQTIAKETTIGYKRIH